MGRLTTTLTSTAAAGLTALVITVAAPASGGNTPPDKGAGTVEHREGGNTTPLELQACLQSHGATGVPGEEREGRALKEWIVAHQDDEAARAALKACDVYFGDQKPDQVGQVGKTDCSAVAGEKSKAVDAAKRTGRATRLRVRPAT